MCIRMQYMIHLVSEAEPVPGPRLLRRAEEGTSRKGNACHDDRDDQPVPKATPFVKRDASSG
jgi:hypothetical protein